MPWSRRAIEPYVFDPAKHAAYVARFEYDDLPWETEVFDWIKGGAGPARIAKQKDGEVIVYAEGDELIGFSAVGTTGKWTVPPDKNPVKHTHITYVGIDKRYRGKPEGPRDQRYSSQILRVITARAAERTHLARVLSLFVDSSNEAAIAFYRAYGFLDVPGMSFTDKDTGKVYPGMAMRF